MLCGLKYQPKQQTIHFIESCRRDSYAKLNIVSLQSPIHDNDATYYQNPKTVLYTLSIS